MNSFESRVICKTNGRNVGVGTVRLYFKSCLCLKDVHPLLFLLSSMGPPSVLRVHSLKPFALQEILVTKEESTMSLYNNDKNCSRATYRSNIFFFDL